MKMENFSDIYKKYHRFSVQTAFRIVKDPSLAEDISQEVFFHLYEIRDTLDTGSERKLRALIFTATINKTKDFFKKRSRKWEICTLDSEGVPEPLATLPGPEEVLLQKEEIEYRRQVLEKLRDRSPLDYELLVRIKVFGISPASAAEEYGMTRHCVDNRIHRTRKWMRKELKKLMEKPLE